MMETDLSMLKKWLKAEDVLELLEENGTVPEELKERIMMETDLSMLKKWLKAAAKAESVEQFIKDMD